MYNTCIVTGKYPETENITSFYLKRKDGKPLTDAGFQPGQFFLLKSPDGTQRAYTVSAWTVGYDISRVSIKRVAAQGDKPAGIFSNWIIDNLQVGDELEVSIPMGTFVLKDGNDPLILVSSGVGITPMLTMLGAMAAKNSSREIHFIHVARSEKDFPMKDEVAYYATKLPNLSVLRFYTREEPKGEASFIKGRPTLEKYRELGLPLNSDVYICGSEQFMTGQKAVFEELGVPGERIAFEMIDM
jgi:nitric oxide dioxygenase